MATSIDANVYEALQQHLVELGLEHDVAHPGVHFPGKGKKKPDTYIRIDHIQNGSLNYAIGDEPEMVQGIFQVTPYTLLGIGLETGQEIAGQIKTHFAKGLTLWGTGVRINVYDMPDATGPITDEDRMIFPVSIYYQATAI